MLVAAGCSARYDTVAGPARGRRGGRRARASGAGGPGGDGARFGASGRAAVPPVFEEIDLRVDSGELLTVVGRSGSGKSTLLLVLAGLMEPSAGRVDLDSEPVRRGDSRIGLVLQHYGLFPWYTALENIELGMRIRGNLPASQRTERARAMLDRIGLAGMGERYPGELSGGEQQRVALARTLVLEPSLLLLDEPFSALDALTREELQEQLLRLLAGANAAAVMVTHSLDEAVYLGDRIGILGPARQSADGDGILPGSRLLVIENPAPPSAQGVAERRRDPSYLSACAEVRDRFREELDA